ncbi:Sua5 family C-terminal domain-containing protein [Streptomyces virginiae]|uniref:Sua5 family C-terminal domain-containing protein n=1 Tax=Streptomyces virginiae TaxID=1961 RepID=UPI002DDAC236|nr:Sua5 family C-terminal domain-containing protein [Streptomyces virginiae]WSC82192.1 hypothetical protein OHA56_03715 [Streptomyces virginiae]
MSSSPLPAPSRQPAVRFRDPATRQALRIHRDPWLGTRRQQDAYAHGLYGFLRELDQQGCDLIIASLPPEKGLGLAIANRLRRAAGPRPSR